MKFIWVLMTVFTLLGGTEVTIATYNVENLFDMNDDGNEYEEYIPNTSWGWNDAMYRIKLRNTAKVIHDINADIIGLQEIESETALKDLKAQLNRQGLYYPHYAFARAKNTTVAVALLSRYPIVSALSRSVGAHRSYRDILEVKVDIQGKPLRLFVNHWKSKAYKGDEYRTFVKSRKHNDTDGITGINHILQTIDDDQNPITYSSLKSNKDVLYNLWYELPEDQRWSHQYKQFKEGLDNIIISPALADGKGLEYVHGSFTRFEEPYLFYKGKMYRWQQSRKHPKHHLGEGYSDHLPLSAKINIR
ncbi:MAG: hypothetical protein B7Y30_06055 [Campylobacterales bacterium 16-40-21]|nr:MAG: hypothetical protein B7Y30_06055 [Campylobacterales bacterium 16-40-21]